jgi:hypothetical protein
MTSVLKKVWRLFTPAEQRRAVGMLALLVLMAMAETVGVISIMPFLSALGRPAVVEENSLLRAIYQHFGFTSPRDFTVALGLASIALVIGSSAFKTMMPHLINCFVHRERHSIKRGSWEDYLR